MKKVIIGVTLLLAFLCSSCVNATNYGPCIGAWDTKNPKLTYKASTQNMVMAGLFIETIVVPIVVINDNLLCPVGNIE